jgi:hypothetical protein
LNALPGGVLRGRDDLFLRGADGLVRTAVGCFVTRSVDGDSDNADTQHSEPAGGRFFGVRLLCVSGMLTDLYFPFSSPQVPFRFLLRPLRYIVRHVLQGISSGSFAHVAFHVFSELFD